MTRHPEQPGSSEWMWQNQAAFDQNGNRINTDSHMAGLSTAPVQRPMVAPSFMANDPYSAAPQMASMAVTSFPTYQYAPYAQSVTPMVPPGGYPVTDTDLKQEPSLRHHHQQQLPSPSYQQRFDTYARPTPSPRSHEYGAVTPDRSQGHRKEHESTYDNVRPSTETKVATRQPKILGTTSIDVVVKLMQDNPDKLQAMTRKLGRMSIASEQPGSPRKAVLIQGRRYKPRGELKFLCSFENCGKRFRQNAQRTTHERVHTGEKPFKCGYKGCPKAFPQAGNLTSHQRCHTGERPFQCNECLKTFTSGGNLGSHKKTHRKEKVMCRLEACGKGYSNIGNLKSHQNKAHHAYCQQLWARWASCENPEEEFNDQDLDAMLYLVDMHKHSNQGIPGRGKGNHVKCDASARQYQNRRRGSTTSISTASLSPVSTPATSPTYASSCSPSPILAAIPGSHHYSQFHPTFQMAGPAMNPHQPAHGLAHPAMSMNVRYDFAHRDGFAPLPPRSDFPPRNDFPREY